MTFLKKTTNRRVGSFFAVAALVLATITPGLVPAFASAAQLTERSVTLSSSSKTAEDVTYGISFKAVGTARAVVIDFCQNSPLIGAECDAPADFDVDAATTSTSGFTKSSGAAADGNTAVLVLGTGALSTSAATVLTLEGVTNPSTVGSLYARIISFTGADAAAAETAANAYVSDSALGGGAVDQGGAAVSITDTIGVSGAVLESMTFCVAGNVIDQDNCTTSLNSGTLTAPTLKLGEDNGGVVALTSSTLSQGSIYTQLSTNAAGGAVVNLKSGNECGGLKRATETTCDIVAANTANGVAAANAARLGVTVNPTGDTSGAFGTLQIVGGGSPFYSASDFKLNYTSGGASGVTSPFGDPVLDTASGPASNKNATITFGASVTNQTPAGLYSNDYSLIATGKY